VVGRIAKPHGVHGDLLVDIITDFPERLDDGVRIGVGDEDSQLEFFETHRVRYHKGRWLLSIKGIRDRAAVEYFRGRYLFLPEQSLDQLPDGYYYEHHLVGLECRAGDGTVYGQVVGLDPGVGQTRLLVRRGRSEYLVPYVPEIVRKVDLEGGCVLIDPPPGLLDDDSVTA
jgi:16S rRNA processing protein RimM